MNMNDTRRGRKKTKRLPRYPLLPANTAGSSEGDGSQRVCELLQQRIEGLEREVEELRAHKKQRIEDLEREVKGLRAYKKQQDEEEAEWRNKCES